MPRGRSTRDRGQQAERRDVDARRTAAQIAEQLRQLEESAGNDGDRLALLHEITVYQEELIVQNEALMSAQTALEEIRDRFVDLYEFAPNAYVTLDANGIIRQCNVAACALFGRSRLALEGSPFLTFVARESRKRWFEFLRGCRSGQSAINATLQVRLEDGRRDLEIVCQPHRSSRTPNEYLTAIVDVTERNEFERERARKAAEYAALANRLLVAQDGERQRIARDLHDNIGQRVTTLRLAVESLLQSDLADKPRAALVKVQDMIRQLDGRLHFVATELRPASLDMGLVTSLEQFVRDWSATFHVRTSFHTGGLEDRLLSPEVEVHLYRIAQEALNNVAKHARADHVSVLLEARGDEVVLIVEDNGKGFDMALQRETARPSLGLVSMRERAQLAGGRVQCETAPGQGTSIHVRVPATPRPG